MIDENTSIPRGWKKTTLGKQLKIGRGSSPRPIQDFLSDRGIPWVKISDASASETRYILKTKECIREEGRSTSVRVGDLIVSNSATPGIPKFMGIDACVHDGWLVFDDYKELDKLYLYYFFLDYRKILEHSASGTVFVNLKTEIVRNVEINLPSIQEQQAIAGVLGSLDNKIELLREQNKTLETTAQEIFNEWFINFKFPGANGKMIDSEIGKIPAGWRVGRLGEEFDITIGRTPPRNESEWFSKTPTGKKWISIKDIGNSEIFISNTSEYLTDEAINKFNIPIIPENTAILSFKMTVGRVAITTEEMLSNEAIAHLKLKRKTNISTEYIFSFLKGLDFNSLGSTSSIVTAINSSMIKKIEILIPEEKILEKFNTLIQPIFAKLKNNSSQIKTLSSLRDTLLPKLMKGEIRVNGFDN